MRSSTTNDSERARSDARHPVQHREILGDHGVLEAEFTRDDFVHLHASTLEPVDVLDTYPRELRSENWSLKKITPPAWPFALQRQAAGWHRVAWNHLESRALICTKRAGFTVAQPPFKYAQVTAAAQKV